MRRRVAQSSSISGNSSAGASSGPYQRCSEPSRMSAPAFKTGLRPSSTQLVARDCLQLRHGGECRLNQASAMTAGLDSARAHASSRPRAQADPHSRKARYRHNRLCRSMSVRSDSKFRVRTSAPTPRAPRGTSLRDLNRLNYASISRLQEGTTATYEGCPARRSPRDLAIRALHLSLPTRSCGNALR